MPDLPKPLYSHGMTYSDLHKTLYVCGGLTTGSIEGQEESLCYSATFTDVKPTWTTFPMGVTPRSHCPMFTIGDLLYFPGGYTAAGSSKLVSTYDMVTNSWSNSPFKLPEQRSRHCAAVHGNEFWIIGGLDR